jgi:hypothetical protein
MKMYGVVDGLISSFSILALDGGELLDLHPTSFIHRERAYDIQWIDNWICPGSCLDKNKSPFSSRFEKLNYPGSLIFLSMVL